MYGDIGKATDGRFSLSLSFSLPSSLSKINEHLAGVAQWIEHQKVAGSIPRSGHTPGLRAMSSAGDVQKATYGYISHTLLLLSLSFSLPFSKNK